MQSKKPLIALAIAGMFSLSGAVAAAGSSADEMMPSSGYQGWGPMANLETPYSPNESSSLRYDDEMHAQEQHLTEVEEARDSVWVANADLRAPHESHAVAEFKPNFLLEPFRLLSRRLLSSQSDR